VTDLEQAEREVRSCEEQIIDRARAAVSCREHGELESLGYWIDRLGDAKRRLKLERYHATMAKKKGGRR
jgi:hypothetical protein